MIIVLIAGTSCAATPPPVVTADDLEEFTILPLGIVIDGSSVVPTTLVRGLEDGEQAVDFEHWRLAFDAVTTALQMSILPLENGQMELRSPGLITRISPEQLKIDPELGLALSILDIETLFHVPAEFDMDEYAIIFTPPWLNIGQHKFKKDRMPVLLDGLPKISPDLFNFSAIGQQISHSGYQDNANTEGNLFAVGKLGKGSWYFRAQQRDLFDFAQWRLSEGQYFHQSESTDYVLGSQATFWLSGNSADYWGATMVKRHGFGSLQSSPMGFDPALRRQSGQPGRSISGEAPPGTLVRLVEGFGDTIIAETLVDSAGIYRFENVASRSGSPIGYRVLLYPDGILTTQPEERKAHFDTLAGQLEENASAWIISGGVQRATSDSFWGKGKDFRGGVAYRRGVSDSLTLGIGLVQEDGLNLLEELYYQPSFIPLGISLSALLNEQWEVDYNANVSLRLFEKINFNFVGDRLSERFFLNWRVFPGFSLQARNDSRTNLTSGGFNYSTSIKRFYGSLRAEMDTDEQLRGNFTGSWKNLFVSYQKQDISDIANLEWNISDRSHSNGRHSLRLKYQKSKKDSYTHELNEITWHYESSTKEWDGRNRWRADLGYAFGSHGSGLFGSLTTSVIPAVDIRLRYQDVSLVSDETTYYLELVGNLLLQPIRDTCGRDIEQLRGQGGLFIRPFMDKNANETADNNEEIVTENAELMLFLNNEPVSRSQLRITGQGVYAMTPPGTYRLDLDPAGYPIGAAPAKASHAVEVTAGGYTAIDVPFSVSYTVAGIVRDEQGQPIGGVKVEAIPKGKGVRSFAVTNSAGIFFVDNLRLGVYEMLLDGQPTDADPVEITPDSEMILERNLTRK